MAKLILSTDDGEVLGQWYVTGREIRSDDQYNLRGSFARSALINEVADEVLRHEETQQ